MIELAALAAVLLVVIALIRPGKARPLDTPLVVGHPGRFHLTLAPQLRLAQPFMEAVATETSAAADATRRSATLCFEVRDRQVVVPGQDFYLLAITQRKGQVYLQAICPPSLLRDRDSLFSVLTEFANAVLVNLAAEGEEDASLNARIVSVANDIAQQHGIKICQLFD